MINYTRALKSNKKKKRHGSNLFINNTESLGHVHCPSFLRLNCCSRFWFNILRPIYLYIILPCRFAGVLLQILCGPKPWGLKLLSITTITHGQIMLVSSLSFCLCLSLSLCRTEFSWNLEVLLCSFNMHAVLALPFGLTVSLPEFSYTHIKLKSIVSLKLLQCSVCLFPWKICRNLWKFTNTENLLMNKWFGGYEISWPRWKLNTNLVLRQI